MSEEVFKRRSENWFKAEGKHGYIYRERFRNMGFGSEVFSDKPVIGIATTWSELNPCNAHLDRVAEAVKRGVWEAGGFPLEFPTMSLGEPVQRPTTMLWRNLLAMETEELIRAIEKVLSGELYYSAEIANRMISMKLKATHDEQIVREKEGLKDQLSQREVEIIKFIVNEHTNEEISKILELSKRTVDNHRQNILTKLNLRNTAGLVRFAVENGILQG